MLFNSLQFLLFFPIVCILYWGLPHKFRNGMLLIASYYFYMNWEPIYALLILFSTVTTWYCGLKLKAQPSQKKLFLTLCLLINFSILFIYKYLNFITESVFYLLNISGLRMEVPHFNLLLPVGISFYTFQAIGYTIDVYRNKIEPERHLSTYALFVSFFPQLVAGPIERAGNLLSQFYERHRFNGDTFIEGLKLMIWGYFMKLCIAENVAPYVNAVYNNIENHNGTSLFLATFFFTFQIFCDFGGYSLIAIGTAKCLGFSLMQNFNHPYLSRSMKEFWRRWHISLSSWFMEYLYIPLGGSRCSQAKHIRNLFLTMLISGIWHGANWTFIWWGAIHGIFLIVGTLRQKYLCNNASTQSNIFITIKDITFSFLLAMFGWIFFRANCLHDAFTAIKKIFTEPGPLFNGEGKPAIAMSLLLIILLMLKECKDEFKWKLSFMHHPNKYISTISTALMVIIILLCAKFESGQFIYFQF